MSAILFMVYIHCMASLLHKGTCMCAFKVWTWFPAWTVSPASNLAASKDVEVALHIWTFCHLLQIDTNSLSLMEPGHQFCTHFPTVLAIAIVFAWLIKGCGANHQHIMQLWSWIISSTLCATITSCRGLRHSIFWELTSPHQISSSALGGYWLLCSIISSVSAVHPNFWSPLYSITCSFQHGSDNSATTSNLRWGSIFDITLQKCTW